MTNRLNRIGDDKLKEREAKRQSYEEQFAKLDDAERKRFEELMADLFKRRNIDPVSYKALAEELRWEKLPLFLENKGIGTFHTSKFLIRILLAVRDRISSALRPKSSTNFEVPDGEIIDKE